MSLVIIIMVFLKELSYFEITSANILILCLIY